ncbi:hypothetical protein C8R45DRAFT_1210604 [Mycena sanguinolenta]|nr:hypothetical protein C8R45DRAFT_1210604 [Mycena sanguinolenta]
MTVVPVFEFKCRGLDERMLNVERGNSDLLQVHQPGFESIWELELAASNGGGTSGGKGAELSGNNQIISPVSPGNEKGSCSRTAHASRLAAPASPAGADAYGRRPRIRSGAALVDEVARSASHRARCAHYAGWERVVSSRGHGHRHSRVSLDCERGAAFSLSGIASVAYRQPRTLPAAIALVACLPSLFTTAVAMPLAATLLAHHAPGIAHNHLAAVHAPPEPPPLATPAVPNVAR